MPTCPSCGHKWYERNARIRDASDLAAQIDERLAAFGDAAGDVRRFLACARSARKGGMAAGKTLTLLSDFYALHAEDPATFAHALHQTLQSDKFDWKRPNLVAYVRTIFKSVREKGGAAKIEDQADEIALVMLGVWHRFANIDRLTEAACGGSRARANDPARGDGAGQNEPAADCRPDPRKTRRRRAPGARLGRGEAPQAARAKARRDRAGARHCDDRAATIRERFDPGTGTAAGSGGGQTAAGGSDRRRGVGGKGRGQRDEG